MMLLRGKRRTRGSTLIEVMISVAIFLLGMQSLLSVSIASIMQAKRAEYVYKASGLAKNHMERLRAYSFAALSSAAETSTVINSDGDPDTTGSFIRTTTVTTNYNSNSNLTQVTVQVWFLMKGVQSPQPMTLSCVMYNG
ncbi:MAG TPA: prepilin-type N-terminal cleavage/methylation domain-containing protein [Candidatus Eisenbacteria bacterium]|jgi:Tfp pilus assembly protein PilV|nr:prepilin-type N-terminal cleavage/methylation domain-containing protein [Candidatus Eisenbacteria bacterium]